MSSPARTGSRSIRASLLPRGHVRSADAAGIAMVLAPAAAIGLAAILRRPDLTFGEGFLGEHGHNLLVVDHLLRGDRLYADVFHHYGPVSPYLHLGWAWAFGNTARSYATLLLGFSLLNVTLAFLLVRRVLPPVVAGTAVAIGWIPGLLTPGGLLGGYTNSAYIPVERTLLLILAVAWVVPWERTARRSAALGAVLGLWQGVKFGGAIFAGAGLIIADLAALWLAGTDRAHTARWLRALGYTLGAFLTVESIWIVTAFATLPGNIAFDLVWPAYHLQTYALLDYGRGLYLRNWKLLVGQYLTPAVAAAVTIAWVATLLRRRTATPAHLGLLIPAAFYGLGCFGYFAHEHLLRQYMWTLLAPSALFLSSVPRSTRLAILAAWLPGFALNGKAFLLNPPRGDVQAAKFTMGEELWLPRGMADDLQQVAAMVHRLGQAAPGTADAIGRTRVVFAPVALGIYHYHPFSSPIRNAWLIPGFFRPYDEEELVRALDRTAAIVLVRAPEEGPAGANLCTALHPALFGPQTCQVLGARLEPPRPVGSRFWVYPVKPRAGTSDRPAAARRTGRAA